VVRHVLRVESASLKQRGVSKERVEELARKLVGNELRVGDDEKRDHAQRAADYQELIRLSARENRVSSTNARPPPRTSLRSIARRTYAPRAGSRSG
jgi:hypothetical protein